MDGTTTTSSSSPDIVFYDIAFAQPYFQSTCAPNPWKARYALNSKHLSYKTTWVHMTDITTVRQNLNIAPCRQLPDGRDFYTLPIATFPPVTIGDSFDIATHLQSTYPSTGDDLFPPQALNYTCPGTNAVSIPLSQRTDKDNNILAPYAAFNTQVDTAFTLHVGLVATGMRWDADKVEPIRAEFVRRAGVGSWEDLSLQGEERRRMMGSLRETVRELAALFVREGHGPFLLGTRASYADFIVGGWLRMFSETLEREEWEEMSGWFDGVFGQLHDALQERFGEVR